MKQAQWEIQHLHAIATDIAFESKGATVHVFPLAYRVNAGLVTPSKQHCRMSN